MLELPSKQDLGKILLQVAENSQDLFLITDQNLKLIYINQAFEKVWGKTQSELQLHTHSWMDSIPKEDQFVLNLNTPTSKVPTKEVFRIIRPDGQIKWIRADVFPIFSESNNISYWVRMGQDITDEKNNREYLDGIFVGMAEKSRDVFWVRSADYKSQLYISPVFEHIWGRPCSEVYRYPERWDDWIYPDDMIVLKNSIAKRNSQTNSNDMFFENYRIMRPEGELRWIRDISFPIFNSENKLICFAGIAQDITEDKKREAELALSKEKAELANKVKTQLIRNLSHDIRTPLGGIIGMTELIMNKIQDKNIYQDLQQMQKAGNLLLNLLNDIMLVAQTELGEIPERCHPFSLLNLLQDVIDLFLPASKDKHLELNMYYDAKLPAKMKANDLLLHQVIMNLVGNAIKFTDKGSVEVSAKLLSETKDKLTIGIDIRDSGIGIPADKKDYIFAPFNRLSPSYENKYKGSGLGLYLVSEFVRHLDGEIHVESELGKGSVFACIFTFDKVLVEEESKIINYPRPAKKDMPVLHKHIQPQGEASEVIIKNVESIQQELNILMVEDDLLAQKMGQGFFAKLGYIITVASNGAEALKVSEEKKRDLIVMDLGLPDMGGCEITQKIRANKNNPNQNTIIVALTAHADEQIRKDCIAAGMQMVFDKPLNSEKVENIINLVRANNDESSLLDLKIPIQMLGDEQMVRQILDDFIKELPERKQKITIAFTENNYADLQFHVHKLHGALGYCGAPRFKEAAKNLEAILLKQEHDRVPEAYQHLLSELENFIRAYQALKNNII